MLTQKLVLGSTYRIKFKGPFERHGVCTTPGVACIHPGNGVFRLEMISSFNDIVMSGIKLYDSFFAPMGISEDDYHQYFTDKPQDQFEKNYVTKRISITGQETVPTTIKQTGYDGKAVEVSSSKPITVTRVKEVFVESNQSIVKKHVKDSLNYAEYPIYKLVDVVDQDDVIYVPELAIDGFPEIDIKEYKDITLAIRLGLLSNINSLDPLLNQVREVLACHGYLPDSIKLFATDTKWMNSDEYESLKTLRVPAVLTEMTKTSDDVGSQVLINGTVKNVVDDNAEDFDEKDFDPSTMVKKSSLVSQELVIDLDYLLDEVTVKDIFEEDVDYYEEMIPANVAESSIISDVVFRKLSAVEKPTGQMVINVVKVADGAEAPPRSTRYNKNDDTYVLVPYMTPEERKNLSGEFYKFQITISEGELPTDEQYVKAKTEELEDASIPVYMRIPGGYVKSDTGSFYAATRTDGKIYIGGVPYVGTGKFRKINPVQEKLLHLVGAKFTFVGELEQVKTVTLEMVDAIDFAENQQKEEYTIPTAPTKDDKLDTTDAGFLSRWSTWAGRYFETIDDSLIVHRDNFDAIINDPEPISLLFRIPMEANTKISGMKGSINGQNGSIKREVYRLSRDAVSLNYYLRYQMLQKERDILQTKMNALEDILKEKARRKS